MPPFEYGASVVDIRELNFLAAAPLQNDVTMLLGELVKGLFHIEVVVPGK